LNGVRAKTKLDVLRKPKDMGVTILWASLK
jgi:hypothetical protein